MSIKTNWINRMPMSLRGMASVVTASIVEPFTTNDIWDICVCDGCDFIEYAFVNNGGATHKNDWKSFIGKRRFLSDTITFKLLKDGLVVATLNSSTYGTYYNFNNSYFVNGEVNFPDYKGFIIDWNLVQQGFGYGKFLVRTEVVSLGVTYTYDSWEFQVIEYSDGLANGTVKIEGYQNGLLRKYFDYTGLSWPQMVRIDGKFGNKTPTYTEDSYQSYSRDNILIEDKITDFYELETHLLPSHIFNLINYNLLRANELFVTDYNLLNQEIYRRLSLTFATFKEIENHSSTKQSSFVYSLRDKRDNDIKTNAKGDTDSSTINTVPVNGGNIVTMTGVFSAGTTEMGSITITVSNSGTYTSVSDDGASGTLSFNKNGAGYVPFASPLVLNVGDTLNVQRTVGASAGYYTLIGTF